MDHSIIISSKITQEFPNNEAHKFYFEFQPPLDLTSGNIEVAATNMWLKSVYSVPQESAFMICCDFVKQFQVGNTTESPLAVISMSPKGIAKANVFSNWAHPKYLPTKSDYFKYGCIELKPLFATDKKLMSQQKPTLDKDNKIIGYEPKLKMPIIDESVIFLHFRGKK
jgi:hypothetical protein